MGLEADIISRYAAVVGDRMWWDHLPEGMPDASRAQPHIILQEVGGNRRQYVDDVQPEFLSSRVQVEVWGRRRTDVSDTMRALIAAVIASNTADWYARIVSEPVGDSNTTLDLRGSRADFMFTYRNPYYVDDTVPATYYLLDNMGDTLTTQAGDRLTWRT